MWLKLSVAQLKLTASSCIKINLLLTFHYLQRFFCNKKSPKKLAVQNDFVIKLCLMVIWCVQLCMFICLFWPSLVRREWRQKHFCDFGHIKSCCACLHVEFLMATWLWWNMHACYFFLLNFKSEHYGEVVCCSSYHIQFIQPSLLHVKCVSLCTLCSVAFSTVV